MNADNEIDAAAGLIHDLASDPPPKQLETIKAATDVAAAQGDAADERRERIRRRAHALWEADGGHHGAHEEFWHRAEAEIDGETS